jgi:NAD(P)H-dependent FMN reductase
MKKILVFGASNSRSSINQKFAGWASGQLGDITTTMLDLNDYEMPIYSVDRQKENGIPEEAHRFLDLLKDSDGVIISFAEHNGNFAAAFKNVLDWVSRIERPIWQNKPMLLLATAPGPRGGKSVLEIASRSFPHQGAQVVGSFSLPSFGQNFTDEAGILDDELKTKFEEQRSLFEKAIHHPVLVNVH